MLACLAQHGREEGGFLLTWRATSLHVQARGLPARAYAKAREVRLRGCAQLENWGLTQSDSLRLKKNLRTRGVARRGARDAINAGTATKSIVDCRSVRHIAQGVLAHARGRLPCPMKIPRKCRLARVVAFRRIIRLKANLPPTRTEKRRSAERTGSLHATIDALQFGCNSNSKRIDCMDTRGNAAVTFLFVRHS